MHAMILFYAWTAFGCVNYVGAEGVIMENLCDDDFRTLMVSLSICLTP